MATPVWQTTKGYRRLRPYTDLCTRTQFRKITIEGKEKLPSSDAAVILAPNHSAGLIDPCMLLLISPRKAIAFGSRSDIFSNPKIASLLHWLRILPIARARNGRDEVIKNHKTFADIIDCLRHGTPFCLYPEGTHYPSAGMLPLKKGVYRIASMAAEQIEDKEIYVVPVGVDYESFFREMRDAAVRIGEPINFREFIKNHSELTEVETIKAFLEELRNRDLSMIDKFETGKKKGRLPARILLGIILLPLFIANGAASVLIWAPKAIIMHGIEDKAWSHTVEYGLHLALPIFWPFIMIFRLIENFYFDIYTELRNK